MSVQNPNDFDATRLPPGARIRAVADAELGPDHLRGIEDAEPRVAFERSLRESVARAMSGAQTAAPHELRAGIQGLLGASAPAPHDGVVPTSMGDTRLRSFWAGWPVAGRMLAVAAVLALCAVVIVTSSRHSTPGSTMQAGLLASFVHEQHDRCRTDQVYRQQKFTADDFEAGRELARLHLGEVPALMEHGLRSLERIGFTFAGMGRCAVPGTGPSVHLVFQREDAGTRMVSLFIQSDRGEWALADSSCALLESEGQEDQAVVLWRDDRFLYFLFAGRGEDLELFRQELGVPSRQGSLRPAR